MYEIVPAADADVVKADAKFWEDHLKAPKFQVVVARKERESG